MIELKLNNYFSFIPNHADKGLKLGDPCDSVCRPFKGTDVSWTC